MKTVKSFITALAVLTALFGTARAEPLKTDSIKAAGGSIVITPIFHASTQIEFGGKVILVDPVSAGSYHKKADLILVTHTHGDHLDAAAIAKVHKPGAVVVTPAEGRAPLKNLTEAKKITLKVLSNGQSAAVGPARVQAVPAYNMLRGPKVGQKFHPKGRYNGYILTLGGKRLYFAGDTEATPEMKQLKNIDAAFLPMNLPFTMTPDEAASAAKAFRPKVVYPYHFRYPFNRPTNNPQHFSAGVKGTGIEVRLLDWYPAAAVQKAASGG